MSCLLKGMIVPLIPLRLHQFRQFYGGGRISTTALDYDENRPSLPNFTRSRPKLGTRLNWNITLSTWKIKSYLFKIQLNTVGTHNLWAITEFKLKFC